MDSRQRINDEEEMLRIAMESGLSTVFTGLPGYIVSFDPDAVTASVQIGVQTQTRMVDGSSTAANYPVLQDVPVEFPRGGGVTLTFPVKPGDECWIDFSARSIGAWKQAGGIQPANDPRRHSLSDAVCRIGPMSQANKITGVSTTAAQLRTDDGAALIEVNPQTHAINIVTTAPVNVTAPAINLGASGQTLLALVTSAFQALFNSHTHASGGAGVPNQSMTSSHMTTTVKGG